MRDLVEYIVKALVDDPDAVELSGSAEEGFELRVAEEDRGKVIGRKGRTAHAIRTVLAVAAGDGSAPGLDIVD